ncbi:MAG: 2-hydroxyacid dehydrogenase [Phycisphaerae bacterium]
MAYKFLVTRRIPQAGLDCLRAAGEVIIHEPDRNLRTSELLALGKNADGWLTMLSDSINATLIQACPTLRGIANYAVGFNNIDISICTQHNIGVTHTPDVLTDATAEIAFALILATARRVVEADGCVRTGQWTGWAPLQFLGTNICGQTLGIVGAGRIGTRVAEMAAGFQMRIIYTARNRKPALERSTGAVFAATAELLRQADFVSLHAPLTAETRHLIGAEQLRLMKPNAILINTARGPLIDEPALLQALKEKRIRGAGLDVFENEPQLTPGLTELKNVVLLPHIGSGTEETRTRMAVMAAEDLIAMVQGRRPAHPVNPEVWDSPSPR